MFGVPYPLFWGAAGAALRFIPYLGPLSAAAGPILIAFAALPGWTRPIEVAAFYAALEIFTDMVPRPSSMPERWAIAGPLMVRSRRTWLWGPLAC